MHTRRGQYQYSDYISDIYGDIAVLASEYDSDGNMIEHANIRNVRTITLQLTDACNLACTYCYQHNKGCHSMPFEVAKQAIDSIFDGKNGFDVYLKSDNMIGVIIDFIGGEPFLETELMGKIIDYTMEKLIRENHKWLYTTIFSICSNGTLYHTPEVQEFLNKYRNLISLAITVDGTKELHDKCRVFPDGRPSYDLAHAAAMQEMKYNKYFGSKITISPENITYLKDCFIKMYEDGYVQITSNCVFEDVWKPEHATEMYHQIKSFTDYLIENDIDTSSVSFTMLDAHFTHHKVEENTNFCGGDGSMLAVDYKGDCFPCLRYMESSLGSNREPVIIGNVWDGLLYNDKCESCLNKVKCTRRTQSTDECFYCPISATCGHCSAYDYEMFGTADKRGTTTCEMTKAIALGAVYFNNMMAKYFDSFKDDAIDLPVPLVWAEPIIGSDEYKMLAELTESLGKEVNYDKTRIEEHINA